MRAEKNVSLDELLGDFDSKEPVNKSRLGASVTIWVPTEYRDHFARLQQKSGRRFSKKVREALIALIDLALTRAN